MHDADNLLLYGACAEPGLVAVEHEPGKRGDAMALYVRRGDRTIVEREPFRPFILLTAGALNDCPDPVETRPLAGSNTLNRLALFAGWKECRKARTALAKATGFSAGSPNAPYLCLNDPVQQYLIWSGRTFMKGMAFEDVRRMQVDIECITSEGYEFCHPGREGDRIVAIGLCDHTGWVEVLDGRTMDEAGLLTRFVEIVRERDPDVIEGHNIFNFDLRYMTVRAERLGVRLELGRDGGVPARRSSRFSVGERTVAYDRVDIAGRHVVDTLFLAQAYDISHRSLGGLGLKEIAVHFGLAARDRTYLDGGRITDTFRDDPDAVMRYVRDDVVETRGVSEVLSRSQFHQAQMLPYSYQNVCVRGTAAKIDTLMLREYVRREHSVPLPDEARPYAGGYTDLFRQGVIAGVHHADVRSLYPTLMVTRHLAPARDELGVFLKLLDDLRRFRLEAKARMKACRSEAERNHYDALQTTFKVLINSFYGYLGFAQGRFSDFAAAESVTAEGRALLKAMIRQLREQGAEPVEIDTDGIYFVPPADCLGRSAAAAKRLAAFRAAFEKSLPEGIEIDFDGEYASMYSYKMKNYALLTADGEIVIKGAALKSRGLEPFQREFLEELIGLRLAGKEAEIPERKARYEAAIRDRAWPIEKLAKTETLQDSPESYAAKRGKGDRARQAAYELALRSGRPYRAGDQISYYVTGDKKNVSVYASAKTVSEWNAEQRDENVPYYLAKLDALYEKFVAPPSDAEQGELELT
jgi:DNA polymerase elongation subunit (family B)